MPIRGFLLRHSYIKDGAKAALRVPFLIVSSLRRRRVVVFFAWPDFARKAEALADLLRRRGLPVVVQSARSWWWYLQIHGSRDLWIGYLLCTPSDGVIAS